MYNTSSNNSVHTGNHNLTHYPDNLPLRCYKYFNALFCNFFFYYLICTLLSRRQIQKFQKTPSLSYISFWMGLLLASSMGTFCTNAEAVVPALLSSVTLTLLLWGSCEREPDVGTSLVSADIQSCSCCTSWLCLGTSSVYRRNKQIPQPPTPTAIYQVLLSLKGTERLSNQRDLPGFTSFVSLFRVFRNHAVLLN